MNNVTTKDELVSKILGDAIKKNDAIVYNCLNGYVIHDDVRFLLGCIEAQASELERKEEENREQLNRIVELSHCIKQITGDLTPAEFVAELIENQSEFKRTMEEREKLIEGLREIDTHIKATSDPIPHIVQTLKELLPEYSDV